MKDITQTLVALIDDRIDEYFKNNPIQPIIIQNADSPGKYMTRKATAKHIGYCVGTVDRFRREGKIKPVPLFGSRSVRYDRDEIDKNIQSLQKKRRQ